MATTRDIAKSLAYDIHRRSTKNGRGQKHGSKILFYSFFSDFKNTFFRIMSKGR